MSTTLPPELIFHIVTFLQGDKPTLSACSQCCSALATITKPLLFHTLHANVEPHAVTRFESLLESGMAVLPLIKKIGVSIPTPNPEVNQRTMMAISRIITHRHMQGAAPELKLATRPPRASFFRLGQWFLPCTDVARPWVTSLELDQIDLGGDVRFWAIVRMFPNLATLILGYVSMPAETLHISPQPASGVSHLTLKKSALNDDRCNIGWLLIHHQLPLPSLISLDVRFSTWPGQGLSRLGEQYGATVRSLRFGAVIRRDLTTEWYKLASTTEFISRFGNLEALTIQGLFVPPLSIQQSPITFEWIPIALGGVSSTARRLTMEIIVTRLQYLDVIPWSAIDEVLSHQLRPVTTVKILLATPIGNTNLLENVYQEMRDRLPSAARRGVLRCSAVVEHPI